MTNTTLSPMALFDVDTIYREGIVTRIAKKLLINLFTRGNNHAYDIYAGVENNCVTIDDLSQEMLLYLCEHAAEWYLYRYPCRYSTDSKEYKLVFFNDETSRGFFKTLSNYLYRHVRRHENKKLWIEIDGEEVKIDDVVTLASHTCIDDVMTLSLYNSFCSYLISAKPKKAKLYMDFINLRLDGNTIRDCAKILDIKDTAGFDCAKQLKTLWKNFNKDND